MRCARRWLYVCFKYVIVLCITVVICYNVMISHELHKNRRSETLRFESSNLGTDKLISFEDISRRYGVDPDSGVTMEKYFINITRSEEVGVIRNVPDTRPLGCSSIPYQRESFPRASVIVQVHEEPWSTLLRTVHSVLQNTPPELLQEIIIIDDNCSHPALKTPLYKYMQQLSVVKLFRSKERLGVIRSRQMALENARGDVLVYIDSHSEVNKDWLDPVLNAIAKDKRTAVSIPLDVIDPNTFQYSGTMHLIRGGFTWSLGFKFTDLPSQVKRGLLPIDTYPTPAVNGGAFAISRSFLKDIGGFDTNMKTWGGEDVEISIRVWLCGGRILISPCSRVGHVYKTGHVYKVDTLHANNNIVRIAETWLGDYKKFFYAVTGGTLKPLVNDSYSVFNEVKKKLQCKPFKWLLENVFPELGTPPLDALYFGPLGIKNTCLGLHTDEDDVLIEINCFDSRTKNFAFLKNGELRMGSFCVVPRNTNLILKSCTEKGVDLWNYTNKVLMFNNETCINFNQHLKVENCARSLTKSTAQVEFRYKMTYN